MRKGICEPTHQQLLSIFIEEYILQGLLNVDALLEVLQKSVEINHILVDALKHLVESGQNLEVILTELFVSILQLL